MELINARLKALADETRFQIVSLLLSHSYCVGAIARHLSISEAAVSQHLKVLRKAGLVKGEKLGYWTHYSVDRGALIQISDLIRDMADKPAGEEMVCRNNTTSNIE
jgi:ArsR family transcriptional regulator